MVMTVLFVDSFMNEISFKIMTMAKFTNINKLTTAMTKCRNTDSIFVVEGINFSHKDFNHCHNTFEFFDILSTFSFISIEMERDY